MAFTFAFFADPSLSTPLENSVAALQALGGSAPADLCVWFGSPNIDAVCQSEVNPGTDPIVLSIVNATPGSNSPVGDIRLALTHSGLSGAMPGAALDLPATVLGGVADAVPVYVRVSNSLTTAGQRDNLSFATQTLIETTP